MSMQMKRRSVSRGKSKKLFSRTAERVHIKNGMDSPRRGGYRL